jgi:hypothetical protein
MTRADVLLGDNRNFQDLLYDSVSDFEVYILTFKDKNSLKLLLQLGRFGDNGPDGNNTVFNLQTLIGIKNENFRSDQVKNRGVSSSSIL